uniref:Uncharacterized protein n=1 Tax=Nelumbo nucifera TaxID=4432 RepID=A0A822YG49_NELNU|nr:TPA_asm: hypothetical protein HUJ06_010319 [Nelumbo nucifera]
MSNPKESHVVGKGMVSPFKSPLNWTYSKSNHRYILFSLKNEKAQSIYLNCTLHGTQQFKFNKTKTEPLALITSDLDTIRLNMPKFLELLLQLCNRCIQRQIPNINRVTLNYRKCNTIIRKA